jgi:hypothetical protein
MFIDLIIAFLIIVLLITGFVHFVFSIFRSKKGVKSKGWYLQLFLSKEDVVSQIFFLFSIFFFGIFLLYFNKGLGEPFSLLSIILLVSIIGVVVGYYFKVIYTLAVGLIGLASWWYIQASEWIQAKDIKQTALLTGSLLIATIFYLLGRAHEKEIKFKRVSMVYLILGLISITYILFFLSTEAGLKFFEDITRGNFFFGSWGVTLSLFIFLILLIGILFYNLNRNLVFKSEAIVIVFLVGLFCIITLLPEQQLFLRQKNYDLIYRGTELSSGGILWAIFFNILVFFELLGIIFLGYLKRENLLINLGVFFVFILIFFKYFDWFFTFLDKSIFFIGAGILLFVVGWFMEKGRRYLISIIKKEEVSQN